MIDQDAFASLSMERAFRIAAEVTGHAPSKAKRFATGMRHYVFEVEFPTRRPVVVRIGSEAATAEMAGAVHLSAMLRQRGVPLQRCWPRTSRLRSHGWCLNGWLNRPCNVIQRLSREQLELIAARVAEAQAITAQTGSAGRYGYAVRPEQAPHTRWSEVLEANLARSRRRIEFAGLFEAALVDVVQTAVASHRDQIDRIDPTPFLHDTTTKNVIIAPDGNLSGIVDVDDLCFGDPRYPAAPDFCGFALLRRPDRIRLGLVKARQSIGRLDLSAVCGSLSSGPDVRARAKL